MISVLVAYLSVHHNLPAVADIDSLSLHPAGFWALTPGVFDRHKNNYSTVEKYVVLMRKTLLII